MYQVELYLRVRRACMVDGMSIRKASRVFGLHRGHRAQDARLLRASRIPQAQASQKTQDRTLHSGH